VAIIPLMSLFAEALVQSHFFLTESTRCATADSVPTSFFFEFFLSENLQVEEIIDLSKGEIEPPEEFKISANSVLQMIIKQALITKGIHDVHTLLELYSEKGK